MKDYLEVREIEKQSNLPELFDFICKIQSKYAHVVISEKNPEECVCALYSAIDSRLKQSSLFFKLYLFNVQEFY